MKRLVALLIVLMVFPFGSASIGEDIDAILDESSDTNINYTGCMELPVLEKVSCVMAADSLQYNDVIVGGLWLLSNDLKSFCAFIFLIFGVAFISEIIVAIFSPRLADSAKWFIRGASLFLSIVWIFPFLVGG